MTISMLYAEPVSREDLVYFYHSVVRPVLEYACKRLGTRASQKIKQSRSKIYRACCLGHRRQHPVRRSMFYAELISIRWLIDVVACAVHCLNR